MPGKIFSIFKNLISKNLILENMQDYYTYDGSLTTPMCYECVRWIVFRDRIGLSRNQVNLKKNLIY